jgi:D-methionine transport system ATP-binding protein
VNELNPFDMGDRRCIRIVFDGRAASEPLIANLAHDTGEKVNILCANTKTVGGVGFGQMIVELPKDEAGAERVIEYITEKGVNFHEIEREEAKT